MLPSVRPLSLLRQQSREKVYSSSSSSSFSSRLAHLLPSFLRSYIYTHNLLPFLTILCLFLLTFWFNCIMQVMTQRRDDIQQATLEDPIGGYYKEHHEHEKHKRYDSKDEGEDSATQPQPQPDLLYRLLPFFSFWYLNDILALTLMLLLLLKFLFLSSCNFSMVMKRYMLCQGALFALRGVSIYLTGMTVPLTTCVSDISSHHSAAFEALLVMIGYHRTCADLLFSGHAAFYTLGFLFVWTYGKGEEWMKLCGWKGEVKKKKKQLLEKDKQVFDKAATAEAMYQGSHAMSLSEAKTKDIESQTSPQLCTKATESSRLLPSSSSSASATSAVSTSPIPLTTAQINLLAHDSVSRQHWIWIPELNAAGDPSTLTVTSLFFLIYTLTSIFFLITTHFHYSVDIFIGCLLSVAVFSWYHAVLKTIHERREGMVKSVVTWMECMPVVGEFAEEETEGNEENGDQVSRITPTIRFDMREEQKESVQVTPVLPSSTTTAATPSSSSIHTYVVYSVTQNRYLLKRLHEVTSGAMIEGGSADQVRRSDGGSGEVFTDVSHRGTWPLGGVPSTQSQPPQQLQQHRQYQSTSSTSKQQHIGVEDERKSSPTDTHALHCLGCTVFGGGGTRSEASTPPCHMYDDGENEGEQKTKAGQNGHSEKQRKRWFSFSG